MRAATEESLPPIMPQGNLVEVLGREVRRGSPRELMLESSPSRERRPPCKTNKEMSDEAADAAALTYLLTRLGWHRCVCGVVRCVGWCWWWCCCWWCDCSGAGLGLGSGFWFGSGSRLRRTSVWSCEGAGAGWGGFRCAARVPGVPVWRSGVSL